MGESYSTSLSELFLSPAARVFRGGSKNVSDRDTRNQRLRLIPESRSQLLESMRWPERALFSGSRGVWLPQLNKGNRTQFDPPVIPTGRRLKTSACLRFYAVFSRGLHAGPVSNSLSCDVSTNPRANRLGCFFCLWHPDSRESQSRANWNVREGVIEKSRTS